MNFGKMEVGLPSDTEIEVTREFDAPRRLVFDAHIKPDLVKRWLHGPDEWPLREVDIDARPGGRLRYVWRSEKTGADMVLRGEYKEIVPPERIVHTELFDED